MDVALSILIILIALVSLVLIHEFGHFLVAKKFNIKVLEFGFGIPPRAWGKKIGETLVSINWLPFGGFVRLLGEDEVDQKILDNKHSFAYQKVYKRIAVVIAGVAMNLVLAWILFTFVLGFQNFKTQIELVYPHQFIGVHQTNTQQIFVSVVSKDSPADKVGLKPGDKIQAFNGQNLESSQKLIDQTKQNAGKEISLTIMSDQNPQPRTIQVTPRLKPPQGQGALGVTLTGFETANLEYSDWWQKLLVGPIHSLNIASYSLELLGKMIYLSFSKHDLAPVSHSVGGPIAIGFLSYEILKAPNPIIPYLNLVAGISFSLALFNILPIPALDGGRLFFLLIEAITRRKVNPNIERYIHTVGMAILLGLVLLFSFSDFNNFVLKR